MYADELYKSMLDDKDGNIPSPLIIDMCIALRHDLLQWQKSKSVEQKASKTKLKADRPHRMNNFNLMNVVGMIASCYAAIGRTSITSPGVADTYSFLKTTWNTLPEIYQQGEYTNTLAIVECPIEQVENPIPTALIILKAESTDNAIVHD